MHSDRNPKFHHEAVWSLPGRGARLIVDLDAIEQNVRAICCNVTPGTKVLAVVKAGGYGHGAPQAASAALAGGASWLGVATIFEGIELRNSGIRAPILVLGPTMTGEAPLAREHSLDITVGSIDQLHTLTLSLLGEGNPSVLGVHLKINTGMNRFGIDRSDAVRAAIALDACPGIALKGMSTHFAKSDEDDPRPTELQAGILRDCLNELEQAGIRPDLVHASNSGAVLRFRTCDFDMVRPGLSIYGVRPSSAVPLFDGMRPALRVEAVLQRVERLKSGDAVGYGGTFKAKEPVRVGLLSFGYADGYLRALSNKAWVGFNGTRLPVVGRVSMDQTVVRLPIDCDAVAGAIVRVAGDGAAGEPLVDELAELANTIPYEILTALGQRLPRCYVHGRIVVACNNM